MRFFYLIILSFLISCDCPIIEGQPGDDGAIGWTSTRNEPDGSIIDCQGKSMQAIIITESNTTIRNCNISGGIRIQGIARNGEDPALFKISKALDYVSTIRESSPVGVIVEDSTITATKMIPMYVGPGVGYTTIRNVTLAGSSVSVMIYLDAESHHTTITGSLIDSTESDREAIAIDSSDHNNIYENTIVHNAGGIFLYRNCGQGGVVRHTTPSYNIIERNRFIGEGYAIILGSREGSRCYCDKDAGWPFGSSASDMDHSRFNIVRDNFLGESRISVGVSGHSNLIENNLEKW